MPRNRKSDDQLTKAYVQHRKYVDSNKIFFLEKAKKYYEEHKEDLKQKYVCTCGMEICKYSEAKHVKRKIHFKRLDQMRENMINV